MKKLIDIKDLDKKSITQILKLANDLSNKPNPTLLTTKTVANLFFENSTRTLVSFELAAKRLGCHVINVNIAKSSTKKGETLKDTLLTLEAMEIDAFIIRHYDNGICKEIKQWLKPNTVLINAGDGNNQHPTQALLDIYTILQYKKDLTNLKLSIIGDIKHSRVANSLLEGFHILGNKDINLFGPKELLPSTSVKAKICKTRQDTIIDADVIIMLRIQLERIAQHNIPNLENYHLNYGLNLDLLKIAKPNCIVLHPGPINRGVEISSNVADCNQSVILEQVKNGVLIRQALLAHLFLN